MIYKLSVSHTHTHTHIYIHVCIHTCINIYVCVYIHVKIYTGEYISVHKYGNVCMFMLFEHNICVCNYETKCTLHHLKQTFNIWTNTHTHIHTHTYLYVCRYVFIYLSHTWVYICTYEDKYKCKYLSFDTNIHTFAPFKIHIL